MSLVRLLTAGKSLVGLRDGDSPYRFTSQRFLPQFGPARNPFTGREQAKSAHTEAPSPGHTGDNGAALAKSAIPASKGEPAPMPQKEAGPRPVRAKVDVRIRAEVRGRRLAALLGGWQVNRRGLFARSRSKTAKSAIPRFPKPAVQGELSLERNQVVRNDLSDADLEIVDRKS